MNMKYRGRGMNWLEKKGERMINENEVGLNEVIERMVFRKEWKEDNEEEEYKNR
ncbi:hypothetical protein THOM_0648 [Trachipleistophora hominis]|uniref:Uncharacterized protein n=1 Tax=Trachipleistophora hominis TaxID=72359 RepID=L7JZ62_TRAHO|nr:hypothetical protein THOM_0648 [Trachipleistophora hominis]